MVSSFCTVGPPLQSLDVNDEYIVTGSYDCTAKVWLKESTTTWTMLHVINLHNDSVWDLRLKGETLVTGGLDGAIGIYKLANRALQVQNFFKVRPKKSIYDYEVPLNFN